MSASGFALFAASGFAALWLARRSSQRSARRRTYKGGCHCGAVHFSCTAPDRTTDHLVASWLLIIFLCFGTNQRLCLGASFTDDVVLPEHLALLKQFPSRTAADIKKVLWVSRKKQEFEELDDLTKKMYSENEKRGWRVAIMDNEAQQTWMAKTFPNTSLLWAFESLNIGAARADLWRMSQLFLTGGAYCDYDAYIAAPFDELIAKENSTMVLSSERPKNKLLDCYEESHPLSHKSLRGRFGVDAFNALLQSAPRGAFTQWFIFSTSGHPLLLSIIEAAVDLVKAEHLRRSELTKSCYGEYHKHDRFHQVLCTTGPQMLSKVVLEQLLVRKWTSVSEAKEAHFLSLVESDFFKYGGIPKLPLYHTKGDKSYFVLGMYDPSVRLLRSYAPFPSHVVDNLCLANQKKSAFWVFHSGALHPFRDWDQFQLSGLRRQMCTALVDDDIAAFSVAEVLKDDYNFTKTLVKAQALSKLNFVPRRAGLVLTNETFSAK